jgi:hypothetical protein
MKSNWKTLRESIKKDECEDTKWRNSIGEQYCQNSIGLSDSIKS